MPSPIIQETGKSPKKNAKNKAKAEKSSLKTPKNDTEKSLFQRYGLSPPVYGNKATDRISCKEAEKRAKREFSDVWSNDTKDEKKILGFLYARGFRLDKSRPIRIDSVKEMIKPGRTRQRMMQVIESNRDRDLSQEKEDHYIRTGLTLHRYFQQGGAEGFVKNMTGFKHYLRVQKFGSTCFLAAPCVAMSYMLQAHHQEIIAPADASKLIRHHFTDDQLVANIVKDEGGSSLAILQILEKKLFESEPGSTYGYDAISCQRLARDMSRDYAKVLKDNLQKGPFLLSRFNVPRKFGPAEGDESGRRRPGVWRFTEWNQHPKFIPFDDPDDDAAKEKEWTLTESWQSWCREAAASAAAPEANSDDMTAVTEEASTDFGSNADEDFHSDTSPGKESVSSVDEFSENEEESLADTALNEGNDSALHAMIVLGFRVETGHEEGKEGETFWLLQNSWASMQLIEASTGYLVRSNARFINGEEASHFPKTDLEQKLSSGDVVCPSPIAESIQFERSDCESWSDTLVSSDGYCSPQDGASASEPDDSTD